MFVCVCVCVVKNPVSKRCTTSLRILSVVQQAWGFKALGYVAVV